MQENEKSVVDALEVSSGFDHGNYANAYETQDLDAMLDAIADESETYRNAAIVAFFASYELHEIPSDQRDAFDSAYFSGAGKACIAAGYCDDRAEDYEDEWPDCDERRSYSDILR